MTTEKKEKNRSTKQRVKELRSPSGITLPSYIKPNTISYRTPIRSFNWSGFTDPTYSTLFVAYGTPRMVIGNGYFTTSFNFTINDYLKDNVYLHTLDLYDNWVSNQENPNKYFTKYNIDNTDYSGLYLDNNPIAPLLEHNFKVYVSNLKATKSYSIDTNYGVIQSRINSIPIVAANIGVNFRPNNSKIFYYDWSYYPSNIGSPVICTSFVFSELPIGVEYIGSSNKFLTAPASFRFSATELRFQDVTSFNFWMAQGCKVAFHVPVFYNNSNYICRWNGQNSIYMNIYTKTGRTDGAMGPTASLYLSGLKDYRNNDFVISSEPPLLTQTNADIRFNATFDNVIEPYATVYINDVNVGTASLTPSGYNDSSSTFDVKFDNINTLNTVPTGSAVNLMLKNIHGK